MGNRLLRVDSAAGTTTSAYNVANMLLSTGGVGASGFQNDADGNTLSGNGRTNAWDSQNRLVSSIIGGNTSTYKYGADGLRRQKTTNGAATDYAYDSTMMVREGHPTGGTLTASTVTATYLIGVRGPEYRRDDTATEIDSQGRTVTKARWYVYDGLGSVVGEVDPLGNLTSSPKFDVYGAVRANGGTATSKQGFVGSLGHVSDTETGLVYMRARYYDPSVGRFTSEDPKGSGINWFEYCCDNPVNYVDETGKESSPAQIDATWFMLMSMLAAGILWMRDMFTGGALLVTKGEMKIDVGEVELASGGERLGKDLVELGLEEVAAGRSAMMAATILICLMAVAMITFTYDAFAEADDSPTIEKRFLNS